MKRLIALLMIAASMLCCWPAMAEVERNALLDAAFSLLEEGNPFLERYNAITGAEVEARFELGMPYFFGGGHGYVSNEEERIFSREPEYARSVMKEQTSFYNLGWMYLYGFDCSGFTQWVFSQAGWPAHDSLEAMIIQWRQYQDTNHVYSHRPGKEMPPYNELAATLQVGDLLVGKKGSRHVMMFIGTLRDFGYTEEEVGPELAPYLDYALVIHCGSNPMYGERISQYLAERDDDPYYKYVNTTNGGVAVSIIGVNPEDAPCHGYDSFKEYAWFELPDGYLLTVWDLSACTSFCWFRMGGI